MGVLQDKEKQEEIREARDFPLDSLESWSICDLNHSTDHCPSLPKMKETYHRDVGAAANSLQQSCQPWPTSMVQNSIPPFPYSHTQSLNTLPPWQLLQPPFNSYLPYPQGWNGISNDHMATLPHATTQVGPSVSTSQINHLH